MEEKGTILDIQDQTMTVRFQRSAMCEKCGACQHANEEMRMQIQRIKEAEVGDQVTVSLGKGTFFKAALVAYGIPLLALLVGLLLGAYLPITQNAEINSLIVGVAFAACAFAGLRLTEPRRQQNQSYTPKVDSLEKLCQTGGTEHGK